jgi:hypothetical protein
MGGLSWFQEYGPGICLALWGPHGKWSVSGGSIYERGRSHGEIGSKRDSGKVPYSLTTACSCESVLH